jgi:transposase
MIKHIEEFKQEAVRIALTSGLPRDRVASDLGIGKSTLGKWVSQYRPSDMVSAPQADLARENERLRLENRVLREEREVLKSRRRLSPPVRGRNGSSTKEQGDAYCGGGIDKSLHKVAVK